MRTPVTTLTITIAMAVTGNARAVTYQNPIIPGFHPDPSCVFVPEWDNAVFCAVFFIAFPAMPFFASRDLVHWKLFSHVQGRPEQFPAERHITRAAGSWYAPTLRSYEGMFYVVNVNVDAPVTPHGGVFRTENLCVDAAWSDLLAVDIGGYDPDIF